MKNVFLTRVSAVAMMAFVSSSYANSEELIPYGAEGHGEKGVVEALGSNNADLNPFLVNNPAVQFSTENQPGTIALEYAGPHPFTRVAVDADTGRVHELLHDPETLVIGNKDSGEERYFYAKDRSTNPYVLHNLNGFRHALSEEDLNKRNMEILTGSRSGKFVIHDIRDDGKTVFWRPRREGDQSVQIIDNGGIDPIFTQGVSSSAP